MGLLQPISKAIRDLNTQLILSLSQPNTKLLVTIARLAVALLCEQRKVSITHQIPQNGPAACVGLQVQET